MEQTNGKHRGLLVTTGKGEAQEAEEGPITSVAEEAGLAEVMGGAIIIRPWRGREEEKRCYDKGQLEGQ